MSPKDFIARWGEAADPLLRFPKSSVQQLAIASEDRVFLMEAGLPSDAAPYLSFQRPDSGELPTLADEWHQPQQFRCYRLIGFDGSGNPIALDESRQGEVVCLDHENRFARIFINKSIRQLAESLLAYRQMVQDAQAEIGEDAWLEGRVPAAARHQLRQELARIDAHAMQPGCFWYKELQNLDANCS